LAHKITKKLDITDCNCPPHLNTGATLPCEMPTSYSVAIYKVLGNVMV